MRLVLASNNTAKTNEIAAFFAQLGITVINYRELLPKQIFPVETTDDMAENARQKAMFIAHLLPDEYVLGDDSGMFLLSLPDRFGATTMREFDAQGVHDNQVINDYVLGLLATQTDRRGYLQANFALITPSGTMYQSVAHGGVQVATTPRGTYSQGLDDIFETETGQTLAELPVPQRLAYAHRGRAASEIVNQLQASGEITGA